MRSSILLRLSVCCTGLDRVIRGRLLKSVGCSGVISFIGSTPAAIRQTCRVKMGGSSVLLIRFVRIKRKDSTLEARFGLIRRR